MNKSEEDQLDAAVREYVRDHPLGRVPGFHQFGVWFIKRAIKK